MADLTLGLYLGFFAGLAILPAVAATWLWSQHDKHAALIDSQQEQIEDLEAWHSDLLARIKVLEQNRTLEPEDHGHD